MAEIGSIRGLSVPRLIIIATVVFSSHRFGLLMVVGNCRGVAAALTAFFRSPFSRRAFPGTAYAPARWEGKAELHADHGSSDAVAHHQERTRTMGFFSKDIKSLDDLFVHTLRDIYYAETEIKKALPDMIEKATNPQLRQGFETHLKETEAHIERVEKVFEMHGVEARAIDCPAIDGILVEANEVAGEVDDKQVLDAALIAAAQAVEHYEITRYGTLIEWAKQLGRDDCASVLKENLAEEKAADKKLTTLAESKINLQAV
jgi:ferritin-like metal-binding protein YciE